MNATTKQDSILRQAIRNLLDGNDPNGTDPAECGDLGWILAELLEAYRTGGTQAVKGVWSYLTKDGKNPELAGLLAGGDGGPLDGASGEIAKMLAVGCGGQPPTLPAVDHAQTLDDLAPFIDWLQVVPKVKTRDRYRGAAKVICRLLLTQKRLILDVAGANGDGGTPYIIGETGETWPLSGDLLPVQSLLSRAGLNLSEPAFRWVVGDLKVAADKNGPRVELARFWTRAGDALYISCGKANMVRAAILENGAAGLELLANGAGGIYFASDATLPSWDPTAEPLAPSKVGAFCPEIVTPPEVPGYTPEVQRLLMDAWLVALVAGVRPLPILATVGDKGGGKTHAIRAVSMLTMLDDPTTVSEDPRDLWTLATRRPVVALDNVDSKPAPWLPDVLAAAVTGVTYERRKLHSDNTVVQSKAGAAFAVSTRTAAFARPDVAERTLPIITGVFSDERRASDNDLTRDVRQKRDRVLTWAVMQAVYLLQKLPAAPTLPGRFVDFGRVVWAYDNGRAPAALQALQQAQALTVGDADPLISAILEHAGELLGEQGEWGGSPSGLVKALTEAGAELPYLGGGKGIARMVREGTGTLALFGMRVKEIKSGNNTLFSLSWPNRSE